MIIGFYGRLSGGKTCSAVKYAIENSQKENKKLISNIYLNDVPYTHLNNDAFIMFLKKNYQNTHEMFKMFGSSIYILDEITNLVDARRSTSSLNELITKWMMMVGKLDCHVFYTCQMLESMVDLRLRDVTDCVITSERITYQGKPIIFGNRILNEPILLKLSIRLIVGEAVFQLRDVVDPQPYYKYYQTREVVLLDRDKYLKS